MTEIHRPTLGETLRSARASKRIKLTEAAQKTRIPLDRLQALEDDRYGDLPDDVYLRGAIRNYAIFLGLGPDEVLSIYRTARPAAEKRAPLSVAPTRRTGGIVPATIGVLVIVVLVLITLVLLHVIVV